MVNFDYDEKTRKGKLVCDESILSFIRNHFSVKNPNAAFANKKLKLRGSKQRIPERDYAIQESGRFEIGMYKNILEFLISEQITEISFTDVFKSKLKCGIRDFELDDKCLKYPLRDYQKDAVVECIKNGKGTVVAATGAGKCHGVGTEVIKYDGRVEVVENLKVGDILMGPDSYPRTIIGTTVGYGKLYKIIPHRYSKSVVVNEDHILSLKITNIGTKRVTTPDGKKYKTGDIVDISVLDYLRASKTFKHYAKWYHSDEIDFKQTHELEIPPYLLGFWLGDGSSSGAQIFKTSEYEIPLREECDKMGWSLNMNSISYKTCNTYNISGGFLKALKDLNLLKNKHIPTKYLLSSIKDRRELLAGLLDSDGSVDKTGFEFSNTNKTIIDQCVFLARSLGYAVSEPTQRVTKCQTGAECISWRIHINSDVIINTKAKIPKNRKINKTVNVSGFDIECIGCGDYYGFELSGIDRRYLLSDFSVTHNSLIQAYLLENWKRIKGSFKVLVIVPGVGLVEQLKKDFDEYGVTFSFSGWTGETELQNTEVVIANTEILCSQFGNFKKLADVDLVLRDECHGNKASNQITKIISKIKTPNKFGFTGTLPKEKVDEWKIIGIFGPIIYEKNSKELRDEKYLTNVFIQILKLMHPYKCNNYKKELIHIQTDQNRHNMIKKLVRGMNKNVLILVNRLEHGKNLQETLLFDDRETYFVHGGVTVDERQSIISRMESQNNIVCIAMSSIFSTGINIKNLHYIMFVSGGKSFIRTVQSIGRGLRLHEDKEKLIIFDLYDNFKYSSQHVDERKKFYDEQQIDWKEREIQL